MGRTLKIYFLLLATLIGLFLYYLVALPKALNWKTHYQPNSTDPMGTLIFKEQLHYIFPRVEIYPHHELDFFSSDSLTARSEQENYILIEPLLSAPVTELLLRRVEQGSQVLLCSTNHTLSLLDSLGIRQNYEGNYLYSLHLSAASEQVNMAQYPTLSNASNDQSQQILFTPKASTDIQILGYKTLITAEEDSTKVRKYPHFLEIPYGKGKIFFHNTPFIYTNYSLKDAPEVKAYAEATLGYLPNEHRTIWLTYSLVKDDIWVKDGVKNTSFLAVVVQQPALKTAWRIVLIGLILYLIFMGKRTQRAIPIIRPLKNTSVEFVESISNLYYQEHHFEELIGGKIVFFLQNIRKQFLLNTQNLDADFITRLKAKSGKKQELIAKIISLINAHKQGAKLSEEDFKALSQYIDEFWQK